MKMRENMYLSIYITNIFFFFFLEEIEVDILENLDFTLITGVPKNPVNEIEKVAKAAADKATNIVTSAGEIDELDYSDLQIQL
jgi:hypothetical protein